MRWTSNGSLVHLLTLEITGAPKVRFGTNIPSMTSRCAQSAPQRSIMASSSPKREKSQESIEGATFMFAPYRLALHKHLPSDKI